MYLRSPASSRIRAKMLYATSKDSFRHDLNGIHYEIQATDPAEMDLDVIRDRAQWTVSVSLICCSRRGKPACILNTHESVYPRFDICKTDPLANENVAQNRKIN